VSWHTREAAREAARCSGISVGEWLDRVILDLALQDGVDPRRFAQSPSDPHDDGGDQDAPPFCYLGWAVKPLCDDLGKIGLMLRETVPRKAVEELESEVRKLADRVEYTRHAGGDETGLASDVREPVKTREALRAVMPAESLLGIARAVQQLSQKVAKLIEKLDASDARLNHLEAIERGLAELLVHLARQRVPTLARVAAPRPDLEALFHDVAELRRTEKKTQDSLEVVRGMLGHIVDRLAVIEIDMRGKAAPPPDAPPAPNADWLASAAQMASKPHSAPEKPATPSTADPASTAPMTPKSATLSATEHRPIDPSLPPYHPVEMAAGKARGERPALPADGVPACESELGAVEPSVNPDRGSKLDFIAAARRAAQAGRDAAPASDASTVSEIALAADGSASDVGRLRALIGGTAAILIVVGLLQIARILVAPSDGVKLTMPSDAAVSRDAPPPAVEAAASAAGLASPASAALFPAGPPPAIFSTADGAAVATSETGIFVPLRTPEQEPEATGQIQRSRHRSERAGVTTTTSAPASGKPAPPAAPLNLDLAMPGPAQ
jgi:localization factor PodJL